jgi:anti-sigma regulatory factor (Ser/Thr protein kinase)
MDLVADLREFDAEADAIGAIRAYVQDRLVRAGASDQAIDAAILCASELATNALLHGDGPIGVDVDLGTRARVTIHDRNPQLPVLQVQPATADAGRGLLMVDLFADAWGSGLDDHGKAVWFELELRAAPPTRSEPVRERRRWRRVSAG